MTFFDRLREQFQNLIVTSTRDFKNAGEIVYVNTADGGIVPARALNDINTRQVILAQSDTGEYFVASSAQRLVLNEVVEISRQLPRRQVEEVAFFYIVVVDLPDRIAEEIVDTGLLSSYIFFRSFLYSPTNSEYVLLTSSGQAQRYFNGAKTENTFSSLFFGLGLTTLYSENQIIMARLVPSAAVNLNTIEGFVEAETGSTVEDLLDATTIYSGDPINCYDYEVTDEIDPPPGSRTETICMEYFNFVSWFASDMMRNITIIFFPDRNTAYWEWFMGSDAGNQNWAVDIISFPSFGILTLDVKQSSMTGTFTKDYSYTPVGSQYPDYSYTNYYQITGTIDIDIVSNTYIESPTNQGDYETQVDCDFTETIRKTFNWNEFAGDINIGSVPFTFGFNAMQSQTYSDEEIIRSVSKTTKEMQYRTSGVDFVGEDTTQTLVFEWFLTKTYSNVVSVSDSFIFGSISHPISYSLNASISNSISFTINPTVNVSEPLPGAISFPDAISQSVTSQTEAQKFSFFLRGYWDLPRTTISTQSISQSFELSREYNKGTGTSEILYYKANYSISGTYTVNFTSRMIADNRGEIRVNGESETEPPDILYAKYIGNLFDPLSLFDSDGINGFWVGTSRLFLAESVSLVNIFAVGLEEADNTLRDSAYQRIRTYSISSLTWEGELRYSDGTTSTVFNLANSLHGRVTSTISVVGSTISINNVELRTCKSAARATFPTSYTYTSTETYTPSLTTVNDYSETTGVSFVNLASFIGQNFLVFNKDDNILYTAELATASPLDRLGESDLTFTIVSQVELKSRAFIQASNSSILVTAENLAASFCNTQEAIDDRLSIKNQEVYLAYFTNPSDVDEQQYVHRFTISGQNLVYSEEILANINSTVDDGSSSYDAKQYVPD